jgi:hypothetical protein
VTFDRWLRDVERRVAGLPPVTVETVTPPLFDVLAHVRAWLDAVREGRTPPRRERVPVPLTTAQTDAMTVLRGRIEYTAANVRAAADANLPQTGGSRAVEIDRADAPEPESAGGGGRSTPVLPAVSVPVVFNDPRSRRRPYNLSDAPTVDPARPGPHWIRWHDAGA